MSKTSEPYTDDELAAMRADPMDSDWPSIPRLLATVDRLRAEKAAARRAALEAAIRALDDHDCGGCPEHSRAFWMDVVRALLDSAGREG